MDHKSYTEYLQSPEWKRKRDERMRIDGGKCQMCLAADAEEVHHLNYFRIGAEDPLKDLVSVCHTCHCRIHNLMTRATAVNPDGTYRYGWRDSLPGIVTRDLESRGLM